MPSECLKVPKDRNLGYSHFQIMMSTEQYVGRDSSVRAVADSKVRLDIVCGYEDILFQKGEQTSGLPMISRE